MYDKTMTFSVNDEKEIEMKKTLMLVYDALTKKGYNPVNQIVGYILSEDPTYITTYNNARSLIRHIDRDELLQAIRMGSAFRHRLLGLQKENNKLRAKLEELRYVSRAKFLLITEQGMSEEAAHRYIEKSAMDTRRTRKEVSLEIIAKYE